MCVCFVCVWCELVVVGRSVVLLHRGTFILSDIVVFL